MEPLQLIFSLLAQAPAVVALLGYVDEAGQQQLAAYPLVAPESKARPYLCSQVVSQQGQQATGCQLDDTARVQLSLFADSYAELAQLTRAVRATLHGYRDAAGTLIDFDTLQDHHDPQAQCLFRSLDFLLELPAPTP